MNTKPFLLLSGFAAALAAYIAFLSDQQNAAKKLALDSTLIETVCGVVEVASLGDGVPVLVSHGALGGYDQGLIVMGFLAQHGFRVIAVSRPGYLRTPLASGESFEAQADLFAALLDKLQIDRATVVAISAGGPAALQFALRYPVRCAGLVMASAISRSFQIAPHLVRLRETVFATDFIPWLMTTFASDQLLKANGEVGEPTPEKLWAMKAVVGMTSTLKLRRSGVTNDQNRVDALPLYPLDQIRVPTLVIHADTDPAVPYEIAQFTATIPDSRLITIEGAGHLAMISHRELVERQLVEFLTAL